jgi:hypothetical protein
VKKEKAEDKSDFKKTIYVKGIGTITSTGNFNVEGWIKSLLQSKHITGKEEYLNEKREKG